MISVLYLHRPYTRDSHVFHYGLWQNKSAIIVAGEFTCDTMGVLVCIWFLMVELIMILCRLYCKLGRGCNLISPYFGIYVALLWLSILSCAPCMWPACNDIIRALFLCFLEICKVICKIDCLASMVDRFVAVKGKWMNIHRGWCQIIANWSAGAYCQHSTIHMTVQRKRNLA